MPTTPDLPPPQGLYSPEFEHDSCGVGFVVDLQGRPQLPHRGTGPALAGQSGASRGPRRRGEQRRRRGNPGAGARRLLQGRRGLRTTHPRQLRNRDRLPPERPGAGRRGLCRRGADRHRGGPTGAGMARRPDRSEHARHQRAAHHAPLPPTLHRRRRCGGHRPGPQGLHLPAPGSATRWIPTTSRRAARCSGR